MDCCLLVTTGCFHYCKFCIYPHLHPEIKIIPANILIDLAASLAQSNNTIHLSYRCDPYQPIKEVRKITRQVIEVGVKSKNGFVIHTRGGMRAARDFDLLKRNGKSLFKISLSFTNQNDADFWEPRAASIDSRIAALKLAFKKGIHTAISVSPVIEQLQALEVVERTHRYVSSILWSEPVNSPVKTPPPVMSWPEFQFRMQEIVKDRPVPFIHFDRKACGGAAENPLVSNFIKPPKRAKKE